MKVGMIGRGAIARYVSAGLSRRGHHVGAVLLRPDRATPGHDLQIGSVDAIPGDVDLMIDCAGHEALASYGPSILARGMDIITVSIGALANSGTAAVLENSAEAGRSKLYLASGAIGALDCLASAKAGNLTSVTYTGRKPPQGWKGSPAEERLNLDEISQRPEMHFEGTARQAALAYPKNANVAAAVALAGLGFDDTQVRLIADPEIDENIHEVEASGDFGAFRFQISGIALPDNPRSSALAAMSVLSRLDQITRRITL